ncbi:LamG-like jellyroll fold domain-containing protein [Actinoplanes sp. M2I2]|uniref:LamG-like jellyroll fold domain-containing protein n=1 Tax=Actinoplanes sp. M2I2 TaxID=1734444 RepID=UPI002021752F|nr:LamG-like jellyroll fold domain-containing protein [Actinoplanes sp. M2I2]
MSSRSSRRRRLSVTSTVTALLTVGAIGLSAPTQARTPAAPAAPGPSPAAPDRTDPVAVAATQARKLGEAVPVSSLTSESSTTSVAPDGKLTTTYSSSPERVRQNGQWVPIDTTLVKRPDGSYAPKAAITDVSFGAGGSKSLVTLKDGDASLRFAWLAELPTPSVSGDTATYANVRPDVDLQVTADATGYSSMLVVKNARAAADPALRKIDFGLSSTGVTISPTGDGGAEAVARRTGETVFHTNTALMWDSSPATAAQTTAKKETGRSRIVQDERPGPGRLGGRRAQVKVGIGGGKQTLTPDRGLLTAKTTTFPVFIDPAWTGARSQQNWARISSNGWNVYNSTAKTGANSARIGLDDWVGGAGERAKTYYQMDTSGVAGAEVSKATLYVTQRWAASCYNTSAVVYGTAIPSSYTASGLSWGHEPAKKTGVLSTLSGRETDCGTKDVRVTPASFAFNVLSYVKPNAKGGAKKLNFLVQAANMDDKYSWKQLGYGGGARLSIEYSYRPKLYKGGLPTVTPSIYDMGRYLTTTNTPTLTAKGSNGVHNGSQENVAMRYEFYRGSQLIVSKQTGFSQYGQPWTIPRLQDGDYRWRAKPQNQSKLWGDVWTAWQNVTIDTVAPWAPKVKSTQFPPKQLGGAFSDKGTFQITPDKTGGHKDNITGYLFSLDGDLSNVTYKALPANQRITWTTGITTPVPGKIYYASADNAAGTGTAVLNGSAGPQFTPGTSGAHKLTVKAVDQAGSTSPQTAYVFYAGRSTPTFATATKLVNGGTATNTDGTTTVVPPAAATTTGKVVTQAGGGGFYFGDGFQAVLSNNGTAKVSKNDTVTYSFNVPSTGLWEVGIHVTTGTANGIYTLVFDKGKPTAKTLLTGYDTYTNPAETRFVNFGVLQDSTGKPMTLTQGVHTLTFTMTGLNSASAGYQSGIDLVRLAPMLTCPINNTTACLNNTAVSTFTAGTKPAVTVADADGAGASFEATDLKAAGWNPGSTITVNGAAVKLPAAYGAGASDNMLASGQIVTVPATGVVNKGNAVVLTGFATHGPVLGATGTITYAQESCGIKSQAYTLDSNADWTKIPAGDTVLGFSRYNKSNATQVTSPVGIFAVSVPLQCPGAVVESITLPVVSTVAQAGAAALHFFGLGIRPTSITDSAHWVGSWSTAQDTAAVLTSAGTAAGLNGQTVRVPVRLSLATGGDAHKVRVRLANSTGKAPVTFGAASFAVQDSAGGAAAAATPVALTFSGAASVTVPAGADVVSDPIALTVPELTTALISLKVQGTLTALAGHRDGRTPIWTSATDGADHTREQAATGFSKSTIAGLPFVTGVDVTTSATKPAGALVLFGDQTVNGDTATANGVSQLDSQLAAALAAAPDGDRVVPFGVLNQGTGSGGNRALLPAAVERLTANANGQVDRRILSQPNVRTVLISSGSSDLLTCTGTADACATQVKDKLVALATQVQEYRSDDTQVLPAKVGAPKVYVATLPPFTASHTAVQETARELVNAFILGSDDSTVLSGYADAAIDFAAAVSTESSATSDTVLADYLTGSAPNDLYYAALAQQYLDDSPFGDRADDSQTGGTEPDAAAVGAWRLDEGTGDNANDVGYGTGPDRETHDAWLNQVSWSPSRLVGKVAGTFNGTSSYGQTDLKPNTTKSFTVSAWVRLTDKSADRAVFTRNAAGYAPLVLFYQKSTDRWLAQAPSAPAGDAVVWNDALSIEPAKEDVWTHLAAVYDSELESLTLYVNGVAETSVEEVKPFNDADGATWIGRSGSTFFQGDIADLKVWARSVNPDEIDDAAEAVPLVDWEFEDESTPGVAVDSTGLGHDGALSAGVTSAAGRSDWNMVSANLNGTSGEVTSPALLRTDQSFSVAAWARLTKTGGDYTVVGQDGTQTGRFKLQYAQACTCWNFGTSNTDAASSAVTKADGPGNAEVGVWTHLAGVHDAGAGVLRLYINGAEAATTPLMATGWNATGAFVAGRTRSAGQPSGWFPGDVDSVRAYQGVAAPELITELSQEP